MSRIHSLKLAVSKFLCSGFISFSPGTIGTLLGVIIYYFTSSHIYIYFPILVIIVFLGIYAANFYEKNISKIKNSNTVFIDEVAGYLVTMISFPFDPLNVLQSLKFMLLGFIIFRIFDIWKPYPVKHFGNLSGGKGILLDDIMAGIYANLILQFIRWQPHYNDLF
ncbi:MAG: phosphatidylglycerophosphatase A [Spirochaetes bacterium]|nr:phosphatidylglycerophosphatase A [Spirochaetota bacterium]